jgi:hypothetical protein
VTQESSYPAHAGIQYAAAPRFHHQCLWNTGSPAFAGDDEWDCGAFAFIKHSFAIQRRDAPGLCMDLSPNRGRGECRVANAPAASRAKWESSTRASSPKVHRNHPAFPHAMVLTAYFVLSPATNSSCHRHRRIKACLRPVGPTRLHQLDTSNGCQDHTALPSASASFVSTPFDRSRIFRPALRSPRALQRCRVHRIPPRVRDDRDTPLCGVGQRGL